MFAGCGKSLSRTLEGRARQRAFVLAALGLAAAPTATLAKAPPIFTTVHQIRALTPDQAAQNIPVRLHGVVTAKIGIRTYFFFKDATAGIFIFRTVDDPDVRPGEIVDITGTTGPGDFAPVVFANRVKIVRQGGLPPARLFAFDRLARGEQDSQWIAVRGIVRAVELKSISGRSFLMLKTDIGDGYLVRVQLHEYTPADVTQLLGATILVRGVCATEFDDKRQFLGVYIVAENARDNIKVEEPAPADPFALAPRSLGSLLSFENQNGAIKRVKVLGVVTHSDPKQGIYIQDGSRGLFVRGSQADPPPVGSRVEVVGYPAPGRYSPQLNDALFRVLGPGGASSVVQRTAAAMLVDTGPYISAPFDGVLVQIKAQLVDEIPSANEDVFILRDGDRLFTARLPHRWDRRSSITPGSVLNIKGVCAVQANEAHQPTSFEVLLRSPDDLVVLQRGPWWNASHIRWVTVFMTVALAAMSAWIFFMRRHETLRDMAVTDALTGLLNRRGFLLLAENYRQLAMRRGTPFQLFYFDVDNFKEINDSLGHKEGDVALQSVAAVLRKCFRKTDVVGRLGGDEFGALVIDAPLNVQSLLEQQLIAALRQNNENVSRSFQLSLSYGILNCQDEIVNLPIEDLLGKADELMYLHKKSKLKPAKSSKPSAEPAAGTDRPHLATPA